MGTSVVSGGGFSYSLQSVGGAWSWRVVASNIQNSGQTYEVVDVMTPFGPYDVLHSPIPGDVITEMARVLAQFQSQLSPTLSLVSPGTSTFSTTVTQGDPKIIVAAVPFANTGALGSFLTVTATPDVNWLSSTPTTVIGLGKNQQGQITIILDPSTLLYISSPFTGHVNLQDNRATPTITPLTVNVTVLPPPIIGVNSSTLTLTYTIGTNTPGGAQILTITNTGPSGSSLTGVVGKVTNNSAWLAFTPPSFGPLASSSTQDITFSVITIGCPRIPGTYTETMMVASTNPLVSPVLVTVQLVVIQ